MSVITDLMVYHLSLKLFFSPKNTDSYHHLLKIYCKNQSNKK